MKEAESRVIEVLGGQTRWGAAEPFLKVRSTARTSSGEKAGWLPVAASAVADATAECTARNATNVAVLRGGDPIRSKPLSGVAVPFYLRVP